MKTFHLKTALTGLALIGVLAGCATKPVAKSEYIFFPPPPDEPRIQFLTSFSAESDLNGQSKLSEFVVGEDRIHRPLWKPYGVTAAKGKLFVCDTEPKNVSVIDLRKRKLTYIRPEGRGALKMPINVAVDSDGTRFVSDTVRGQVLIYDGENQFVGELGKSGEMKPCGLVLGGDRLYVSDLSNHCVRVYSKASREILFTIPSKTNAPEARLYGPTNLALDEQGRLYVSDSTAFSVKIFDRDGKYLRTMGDIGLQPGRFGLPKGIGVDRENRVFVVDAATAIVQLFDAEGKLLMYFGEPKSSGRAGLYLPAGLAIDYENVDLFQKFASPGFKIDYLIYVTNQAGTQKVSVFGFMRKI